jgi:hypothetical protein
MVFSMLDDVCDGYIDKTLALLDMDKMRCPAELGLVTTNF